jgi:sialate O-acetylesterase
MSHLRPLALTLASWAGLILTAAAAPVPAGLFQDHAVLQRDKPVPIWGRADPGEHVMVSFAGQTVGATAGDDGRWITVLQPLAANAAGSDLTITGTAAVTLHDILVGEVWLCAGQSNMEFTVDNHNAVYRVDNAAAEVAAAHYPGIRQFKVGRQAALVPVNTLAGDWRPCTPATVGQFTAVGYFFARDLFNRLGVPVGLINCTWADTPLEAWLSPAALAAFPGFRNGHPAAGAPPSAGDPWVPASLFNGMVQPLLPDAIRGILWYQGESNVGHAEAYGEQFPALIRAWRSHFGEGDLPFLWVQLANFAAGKNPAGGQWAALREAQAKALTLPATGQAVAIDIGDPRNIQPRNKQEVGRRLALLAKAQVYGIPVDASGPVFESAVAEGKALRVHFLFAGEGLTAAGKPLQALEVAGTDRVFHPAKAVIEGDAIVVSSPLVPQPVAVRYAWSNAPEANLFSGTGLPAAPFRSDSW